jgi:hypothetical protein
MRRIAALLSLLVCLTGCSQYRLASLQDVQIPNYEARIVLIPATCDTLITRAATAGMSRLTDVEGREVLFCQQQMIIRAQEEEAASKRLEAHAAAARFALQTAGFILGAAIAVLAWLF